MQQCFSSSRTYGNWRLAFWVTLLFAALFFQFYVNKIGTYVGEFFTNISIVFFLSIVYGYFLTSNQCEKTQEEKEGLPYHLSNTQFIGNKVKDQTASTTAPQLSSTTQTTTNAKVGGSISSKIDTAPLSGNQSPKKRLYYVDNVKIFLTVLVVSHHVTCAFGGCPGGKGWFLIVGLYDNSFRPFAQAFQVLNQGYFMSLFFFMSAYFVPSSFERKGKNEFLVDKAKRYWIPAFFVCFVLSPVGIGYSLWITGQDIVYLPSAEHTWFLNWLLLLNLAYAHIHSEDSREGAAEEENSRNLPGPFIRATVYGLGICGFGMFLVLTIVKGNLFYGMPMGPGSLTNDLLFFVAGTFAKKYGWLEKSMKEQIGLPIIFFRCMVVVEAAFMIYFFDKGQENELYYTPVVILIAGVYCIDMSLLVLEFFQSHLDFQNRYTKILSEAAYTVYIIHPAFVIGTSSLWIKVYESLTEKEIEWVAPLFYSSTPLDGGGFTLAISWLVSNILVHALVWPISFFVRKLPGLRQIL